MPRSIEERISASKATVDQWKAALQARSEPVDSGCVEWRGPVSNGYGRVSCAGANMRAHRLACYLDGREPGALLVMHSCDNPVCINPAHLSVGTDQDNVDDMIAKGRKRNPRPSKLPVGAVFDAWGLISGGESQASVAEHFDTSDGALHAAFRRNGLPLFGRRGKRTITDATLDLAVTLREQGLTWNEVGSAVGHTGAGIINALRREGRHTPAWTRQETC